MTKEDNNGTKEDDHVTKEVDQVTKEDNHVTTTSDHVTKEDEHVISGDDDHVAMEATSDSADTADEELVSFHNDQKKLILKQYI